MTGPRLDHAKPEDMEAIRREDAIIAWLKERLVVHVDRRRAAVNRCSARAYLDVKRNGRKPRAYGEKG